MTSPRPQVTWFAFAAAAFLGLGALGWWARDLGASPPGRSPALSLMDLFAESQHPPMAPEPGRRGVPAPPPQAPWASPLRRSCTVRDLSQRRHLQQLLVSLRQASVEVQVDRSNYGNRFFRDSYGNRVDPTPQVVVLHETVYGLGSAISTFVTSHPDENQQVSYHALIGGDGAVVKLVDPRKRAFGAGNSAFNGHWVVTNPNVGGSVNNFSLHVSLETPLDGENNYLDHSGYSSAQYDALAALLTDWMVRYQIKPENITTHRFVDLGGERSDPRSFSWSALQDRLQNLGMLC